MGAFGWKKPEKKEALYWPNWLKTEKENRAKKKEKKTPKGKKPSANAPDKLVGQLFWFKGAFKGFLKSVTKLYTYGTNTTIYQYWVRVYHTKDITSR